MPRLLANLEASRKGWPSFVTVRHRTWMKDPNDPVRARHTSLAVGAAQRLPRSCSKRTRREERRRGSAQTVEGRWRAV